MFKFYDWDIFSDTCTQTSTLCVYLILPYVIVYIMHSWHTCTCIYIRTYMQLLLFPNVMIYWYSNTWNILRNSKLFRSEFSCGCRARRVRGDARLRGGQWRRQLRLGDRTHQPLRPRQLDGVRRRVGQRLHSRVPRRRLQLSSHLAHWPVNSADVCKCRCWLAPYLSVIYMFMYLMQVLPQILGRK